MKHYTFVTVDEFLFNASENIIIGKPIYAKNATLDMLERGTYRSILDEKSGEPIVTINKTLGANVKSMPDSFKSTECFVRVNCTPIYE